MVQKGLHDINQLPQDAGMLVFGISMSRISTAQDPAHCFKYMKSLAEKIVQTDGVGLTFLYSDALYMHSDKPADELRKKFLGAMVTHVNGFKKILSKNIEFIPQAFSYLTWSQMLIQCADFQHRFGILRKLYDKDETLRRCVAKDAVTKAKTLSEHDIQFVLEESLALHLIAKGEAELPNEFLHGKEQWILHCYPGKPLLTEAFLAQRNPFKLHNQNNKYECSSYDLEERKLYDLMQLAL